MSNSIKITAIIMIGIVVAALILRGWVPLQNMHITLNEVSAIKVIQESK